MLDRVGQLGRQRSGSAVYLGKKWILTANHAFQGRTSNVVVFSGKEYELLPKRAVRLNNPAGSGLAGQADLVMVLLRTAPDLEPLKVNELTPFSRELVVLVGCGETASQNRPPFILTESQKLSPIRVRPIAGTDSEMTDGTPVVCWGENEIAERGIAVGIPGDSGQTDAYVTIRQPHWTEHNAQGASGDSGGGVFVKRGDGWELSGVMLSVIHREELNASATFIADLSVYRGQIVATIPEPSAVGLLLVAGCCGCLRRRRR